MCLTCGCGDAHLEMGKDNITYEDVQRAAESERSLSRRDVRHHAANREHGSGEASQRVRQAGIRDVLICPVATSEITAERHGASASNGPR